MLLFSFVFMFLVFPMIKPHMCNHKAPDLNEVVHGVHIEPHHVMKKRSVNQQLRLHVVYDESVSAIPLQQQNLIKQSLIPEAVHFWEQALSVRHTSVPIKLQRQCKGTHARYRTGEPYPYCVDGCAVHTKCGETKVPLDHLDVCREGRRGESFTTSRSSGAGVANTDFIMYVSAVENHRCDVGTTVAYAAYCQMEAAFDRPVAGYVNLCPSTISTHTHDMAQMHSTLKHEMLHALGFSAGLYAFFRDENGDTLTPRIEATGLPHYNTSLGVYQWSDKIIKSVTYTDWMVKSGRIEKTVSLMVTANVKQEVRRHFNCAELEGAELEDQDFIGTAMSHWEKRLFENEAMTGTYTQNPVVSRITLAALQDTGWYSVNYSMAQPLKWGAGLGCDFVQKSCMEWMNDKKFRSAHIHPYCEVVKTQKALHTECTEDRSAVALCNLVQYPQPLPVKYQYFSHIPGMSDRDVSHYGGLVALADYCPYIQEFSWRSNTTNNKEVVRSSQCDVTQSIENRLNFILESHSEQSMCFEHTGNWTLQECGYEHVVQNWGSGCYKYKCSAITGLSILVHDREYQCTSGRVIRVGISTEHWYHSGTILCPSCEEVCLNQLSKEGGCPKSYKVPDQKQSVISLSSSSIAQGATQPVIPCRSTASTLLTQTGTISSLTMQALLLVVCSFICVNIQWSQYCAL